MKEEVRESVSSAGKVQERVRGSFKVETGGQMKGCEGHEWWILIFSSNEFVQIQQVFYVEGRLFI